MTGIRLVGKYETIKNETTLTITDDAICYYTYGAVDKDKKFRFKKDDVITKINNLKLMENGTIKCDKLNDEQIYIETYIMLSNCINLSTTITFIRDDVETTVDIKGNPYCELSCSHISEFSNYVCWKGFIFTELSEELIREMIFRNVNLSTSLKTFSKLPFDCSKNQKYVILFGINFNVFSKKIVDKLKQAGLPYVIPKTQKDKTLLILDKISNTKIYNLNDVYEALIGVEDQSQTTLNFIVDNKTDERYKISL